MADEKAEEGKVEKKGLPKIAKIALGCLGILIILTILGSLFAGAIIKKIISGAISQKTGVQTNLTDLQNGKLEFTDPKTGAKLNIGTNKIPDDFPKDFPIYPGSSVTSSLSGNQNPSGTSGQVENGYWLTLNTSDDPAKVISYYETNLKANGWEINQTVGGTATNWVVSKNGLSGYVAIDKQQDAKETSILIVLGQGSPAPSAQASPNTE